MDTAQLVQNDSHAGYYSVALFDLLGQQEALKEWSASVGPQLSEQSRLVPALRKTVGRVVPLRKKVREHIMGVAPDKREYLRFSAELQESARQALDLDIRFQFFGDTIVLYAPPHAANGYSTLHEIYHMIGEAAALMIDCLAQQTPIRGAIDFGPAQEIGPNDLYGPALASVHHLESKCAEHPRVLVGPGAINLIQKVSMENGDTPEVKLGREIGRLCRKMIRPVGELWEVDYLGKPSAEILKTRYREAFTRGLRFAESEFDRFTKTGNDTLAQRYRILRDYYFQKQALWT